MIKQKVSMWPYYLYIVYRYWTKHTHPKYYIRVNIIIPLKEGIVITKLLIKKLENIKQKIKK